MDQKECECCGKGFDEDPINDLITVCDKCGGKMGIDLMEQEISWFIKNMQTGRFIGYSR